MANDDTKRIIGGLAAGIIGIALNDMSSKQDGQTDGEHDIEWQSSKNSKPKLQYSDRTAEIQLKLKKTGFYDGNVDGLKGKGTAKAIDNWEMTYGDSVDGQLSDQELATLSEQASNINEQNSKSAKKGTDNNLNAPEQQISNMYSTLAAFRITYDACERFRNSGNPYAAYVDDTMYVNYVQLERAINNRTHKQAKCLNMSDDQLEKLQKNASEELNKSTDAKMIQLGASAAISGQQDPEEFAKGCSTISQSMYMARKSSTTEINPETCEIAQ